MTESGWSRPLRWLLVAVAAVGLLAGLALSGPVDATSGAIVPFGAFVVVGNIVAARRPENPIGWVFLAAGLLAGLGSLSRAGTYQSIQLGDPAPWWGVTSAWLYTWVWFPAIILATIFPLMLFPDGLLSRRWRPMLWISSAATTVVAVTAALTPALTYRDSSGQTLPNPISPGFSTTTGDLIIGLAAWILVGTGIAALASTVIRFRRSEGVEREQMLWFVWAAAGPIVWTIATGGLMSAQGLIQILGLLALITLVPVACGVAILRYRLYDIDRIISRTTSYTIVSGLLLATYAAVVAGISRVLPGSSSFAVAAATLTAAALARPVLNQTQNIVDRRFNRERYNALHVAEIYAQQLREVVDPDAVEEGLLTTVMSSLQPSTAALWVRSRP